ncbi:MAG: CPBP family glutamic-type intramembrane protease [bacterium]|nr:CPBP family glutamic-type intramembrane protease [bacterium]
MKPHRRLAIVILAAGLLACLASPAVWYAMQRLREIFSPGLDHALRYPFYRVMNRVVLVSAILLLYLNRRGLNLVSLAAMGLRRPPGRASLLWRGWLLGALSLALMVLVMVPFGARIVDIGFAGARGLAGGLATALVSGLAVGVIEELFFRGFILQALLGGLRRAPAVIVTSLFFAVVHFFKANAMPRPAAFDPTAGFRALAYYLQPLLTPAAVIPGFVGLFLVGVVLAVAVLRTGSLHLAIGLHAGWVFGIKAEGLFLDRVDAVVPWFFGDGYVVTGVFGWLMLLLMLPVVLHVAASLPGPATPPPPPRPAED